MAPKLKILHVMSQRPDSTGSGIYVRAMIRESGNMGHANFLVAGLDPVDCPEMDCFQEIGTCFVKFNSLDISYPIPGMSDVMPYNSVRFCDLGPDELEEYELAFSVKLHKAVRNFNPDVIHTHHLWILTSLVRRLFPNIPVVTSCHGTDLRQFQNCPHLQCTVLEGCRGVDRVLALHERQKKEIARVYEINPERIAVAGAGYNNGLFWPASKPAPDPIHIVYAGKLSRAKGLPWLLRSLQHIEQPKWILHLVGSGSGKEREECLKLAGELQGRVINHGAVTQEELAGIMRDSHLLVLPSFYEGLPLVLLEGLACGCRVIATALPGVKELIDDKEAEFIELVDLPRLHGIDQPYSEDWESFEQNLAYSVHKQLALAGNTPEIDLSPVKDKLASYTWTGVFRTVQAVYQEVIQY